MYVFNQTLNIYSKYALSYFYIHRHFKIYLHSVLVTSKHNFLNSENTLISKMSSLYRASRHKKSLPISNLQSIFQTATALENVRQKFLCYLLLTVPTPKAELTGLTEFGPKFRKYNTAFL